MNNAMFRIKLRLKYNVLPACLVWLMPGLSAMDISVSLFHDRLVDAVLFSARDGDYWVKDGEMSLGSCPAGESWYIIREGDAVMARDPYGSWYRTGQLKFEAVAQDGSFDLKPVSPILVSREYLEDLHIVTGPSGLLMLNRIDIEKYLMGVVETEAGPGCELEYYKVQAILCRTFALKNLGRHEAEGFQLCDGVHCQAYRQRHMWNEDVEIGVEVTEGLVLADPDSNLINAVYHANSGGETRSAGQAWLKGEPYLRPVLDNFSLGQAKSAWERRIPLDEWMSYLSGRGILEEGFTDTSSLEIVLDHRREYYCPEYDTLYFSVMRDDWNLPSDFFSIVRDGREIVLKGKGYGHGVGLSQEGGMHMARMGYHYSEILNYYYFDIMIIPYRVTKGEGLIERKMVHSQ